jgi:hypothetical protein
MDQLGARSAGLWDEEDSFFYFQAQNHVDLTARSVWNEAMAVS